MPNAGVNTYIHTISIPWMVVRMNISQIWNARGVPIETAGSAREVADRVREGKALLEIVETPWGIEFYIIESGARA